MDIADATQTPLASLVEIERDERSKRSTVERIIEFYEEAGMDYAHWSRGLNMHLGCYRWGMNPFDREAMLEQLNLEVASRLRTKVGDPVFLIDLGCGMGATARSIARCYPNSVIKGVTITPSHIKIASYLNLRCELEKRIEILNEDFTNLPFADGIADGAWAIEGACYASGPDKDDLIQEMARVIKPGGRFVIADCFVKNPDRNFNALVEKCYSSACICWAVPEMPVLEYFIATLDRYGFRDIVVEDISWRAAPSLAHAPFAVATFIFKKFLSGEPLKQHSVSNLKASLLALVLGVSRSKFSYCLISGRKG